jgi:hypothetical protein
MILIQLIAMTLFFAGFGFFGVMDELAHHFDSIKIPGIKNNAYFWDKRNSWKNKWATKEIAESFKKVPDIGTEKFWGSSRWFVFLTDGWHLMQFCAYTCLSISVSLLITPVIFKALAMSIAVHILAITIKSYIMKTV